MSGTRGSVAVFVLAAAVVVAPATSEAQDITTEAKWEVEAHVGIMGRATGTGTSQPFPTARGFTTVTGSPSAAVSSWFFGDGTALFNRVSSLAGVGAGIVPLDQVLQAGITRRRGGLDIGFAAARWLTPRFAVQVQGDYAPSAVVMNDLTLGALEATATSYTQAWSQLFDAGLASDGTLAEVQVSGDTERGGGHQLVFTGGLKAVVHTKRRFRTYVAGALGIANTWNRSPRATLRSEYRFAGGMPTPSGIVKVPFIERDDVTMRAELGKSRRLVGTVHGGFEYYTESRRGVRFDVAVLLSPNRVSTFLDATPSVLVQEPGAAISGTTNPTIQFSSYAANVAPSSLTGPSIRNLETFTGEGLTVQVKVSLGYFFRFGN